MGTSDDNENSSTKTAETGEPSIASPMNEKIYTVASSIEQTLDKTTSHVNSQSVEDYTCLLEKYYELEGQRQMVLQKLNQFGDSSTLTAQDHHAYAEQAPNSMVSSLYCPYGCQSWVPPVMASPSCCVGGNCTDKNADDTLKSKCDQTSSLQQPDIVKTAMGSAEKALSSLREDFGDEGAPKKSNDHVANESKPETALSEVLHAWYSAGFYTGKYLTEQSRMGKKT
ncbi:unnamed protein product [Cuscuta campestris]|nr:unnamed protein product [Cuscuta campestris]